MRKQFIKLTAACVFTALLLYSSGLETRSAIAYAEGSVATNEPLQQQVQQWVDELAVQPEFAKWKQASFKISPVGPGTHSWLVLVKQHKETVGYLIVNAVEQGGYQLGEYGTSNQPIFDEQTLTRSIKGLELLKPASKIEALYVHPLLAAWRITESSASTYYTDAATGEQLPVNQKDWTKAASAPLSDSSKYQISANAKLLKQVSLPSFDRYAKLPWLSKAPLQVNTSSYSSLFVKINNKEQLRYTAELFDAQMLYVWSVVGYNKWDTGQIYVALEAGDDGANDRRYIPLLLLLELGHFYR
ncbi:hypothetical protein FHS15_000405 [Paenibacillus castaneae]|uniref:hypothetical protein n=1 Tax=Paenibacillus castaneae TaxID=474957 RepID=UPI000C9A12FB|nr:hypothetical protein [Paenibacillus castaneae]NIK75307.1 hypothetical protein [Paenibacillus castaneae]